ncbi:DUF5107 domain-containing protein [Cohnella cellulosilytica]|uniref:DUF5107 domain-containing protein n=1 Tax=Cohnella cellulosilytica TaxID=986710 RepID=A0ABW2FIN1_9BACL
MNGPGVQAARVSTEWTYRGFRAVILENGLLRVVILPELGAKIWQITHKPTGTDLLWQHPRIAPRPVGFGASYDDHFFGGWDELFPNDAPETLAGEALPDHGELWTLPWAYETGGGQAEAWVKLSVGTPVSACRAEKTIRLRAGEAKLRFSHRLANPGRAELPFLWKLHAAVKADGNGRIDVGAEQAYLEEFGPPRTGRTGVAYRWPYAPGEDGTIHDMRVALPASSGVNEFQYLTELTGGWCAYTDTSTGVGLGLAFDPAVFPSCWLFATYGGWRGLSTVVLEPCTGYPLLVEEGVKADTHRTLKGGETLTAEVVASVYTGLRAVNGIDRDGNAEGEAME